MKEFIKASQLLGNNIVYVQGAGGNTSVKNKNKIYIKASGFKLKSVKEKYGYACCLYEPISDFIKKNEENNLTTEYKFLNLVHLNIVRSESFGLPSMEIGMHAVIPSRYVFHIHSVFANVFNCMKYGSYIVRTLFNNIPYIIINYVNPGYELAHVLSKKASLPPLIFLKNHGIIIHGQNINTCINLIESLHMTIEEFLKMSKVYLPFKVYKINKKMHDYLFPDSAVFSNVDFDGLTQSKKNEVLEITSAQQYILDVIKRLGQEPSFLTKAEIKRLLKMKQEKHRIQIFKT